MKLLSLLALSAALVPAACHADTLTLNYTGKTLDSVGCSINITFMCGPYPGQGSAIKGSITLANAALPLAGPPLFFEDAGAVSNYSLGAGAFTFNATNSVITSFFTSLDATGAFDYEFRVKSLDGLSSLDITTDGGDQITAKNPLYGFFNGSYQSRAGSFSVSATTTPAPAPAAAVTPEPSSLALLGTGILGTAGVLRRRYFGA